MKRIIFLWFLVISSLASLGQEITMPYNFPIKSDNPEWPKFKSRTEMAGALQIPSETLKNLTTKALAKTCLNFPMFKDLYFFNTIQTGFNNLKQSFNGFQELLSRNDAAIELLKLYGLMNPEEILHAENDTLKGDFSFRFVEIEILLAQEELINSLNTDIETKLLKEAVLKYEQKKATSEFSSFSLSPSMLVAGRILDKKGKLQNLKATYTNDDIQNFLSTGLANNPALLEQILALSKN
ncbi:MAG: hypothetical protein ABI325_11770 [Ginsengibacter sp.]